MENVQNSRILASAICLYFFHAMDYCFNFFYYKKYFFLFYRFCLFQIFKVNKNFYFEGIAALTGSGIDLFLGENTNPTLWVSGSTSTGYNSIQDQFLVYRSIRELYYYNYIDGVDGSVEVSGIDGFGGLIAVRGSQWN